jgi:hypothetical protein
MFAAAHRDSVTLARLLHEARDGVDVWLVFNAV